MSGPTFADFYLDYRAHHRHPWNRALHLLAKVLAVASLLAAWRYASLLWLLAAPVLAVVPCWLGHLWFEGNRPVSWDRPSASLLGTFAGGFRRLAPGQPAVDWPPLPAAGRAYYSFLADLRMCCELLGARSAAGDSPSTSERT